MRTFAVILLLSASSMVVYGGFNCYVCTSSTSSYACNDPSSINNAINCVGANYYSNPYCSSYASSSFPVLIDCTYTTSTLNTNASCIKTVSGAIVYRGCGTAYNCPSATVSTTINSVGYYSSCCTSSQCNSAPSTMTAKSTIASGAIVSLIIAALGF